MKLYIPHHILITNYFHQQVKFLQENQLRSNRCATYPYISAAFSAAVLGLEALWNELLCLLGGRPALLLGLAKLLPGLLLADLDKSALSLCAAFDLLPGLLLPLGGVRLDVGSTVVRSVDSDKQEMT